MHTADTVSDRRTTSAGNSSAVGKLTLVELEILSGLVNGLPPEKIAANIGIGRSTVGTHRERILRKLKLRNAIQLGMWAERVGLWRDVAVGPTT
jgi:DNA-binding NarL/FixJ family response regulator